jgi:hypothetical protein
MIIKIHAEKVFSNIQHTIMVKFLSNLGMEGNSITWQKMVTNNLQLTSYLMVKNCIISHIKKDKYEGKIKLQSPLLTFLWMSICIKSGKIEICF